MKNFSRAYVMLGRNAKESWAYLLTLLLSTSLLFVFVNLQSDANFLLQLSYLTDTTSLNKNYVIIACLILVIAIICAVNCFVANSYYVKAKSQELCVYLSCGMNIVTLAKYLVIQNMILLFGALVGGLLLGIGCNVMLNIMMNTFISLQGAIFTVSLEGIFMWGLIIFFEMIYFVMINVGYAYKAELKDLLDENRKTTVIDVRIIKTPAFLYPFVAVVGLILLCILPSELNFICVGAVISFFGMQGILRYVLPKAIEKKMMKHKDLQIQKMVLRGNLLMVIKSCYLFIIMIFATIMALVCCIPMGNSLPYTGFILCVAYFLIMVVMSISIFFKIMIEAGKRKKEFQHLMLLGLAKEMICKIIKKEMQTLFSYIILFPLPFILIIVVRYIVNGQMDIITAIFLIVSYIVLLSISGTISTRSYIKTVLGEEEGEEENE